jgi:Protein of unknown function (DUF1552)
MKKQIITRRQMLYGAGGFALGLPFLPSLVPGKAHAQDAVFQAPRRFFCMATGHGGLFESAMYPADAFSENHTVYPGHVVRRGELASTVENGQRRVSDVLRGPDSAFSEALLGKMNVLRGLDIPFYIAHHTGGHLGNFARNDGNGSEGQAIQNFHMPTIDQLMAWSSSFYPDIDNVKLRSIVTGHRDSFSYNWSSPATRSGTVQPVGRQTDALGLFNEVFVPDEPTEPTEPPRPAIVDRVIENYRSLRQSNRRMSAADKQRLDDHMDRLAELQRRVNVKPKPLASCKDLAPPGSGGDYLTDMQALLDVIAAGFICGTSRIGVLSINESEFVADNGDWHQSVAHQWQLEGPQAKLQEANQQAFQQALLYLAAQLEVEESPDVSVLDNSLLMWSQESGEETHDNRSVPIVTFGGAAGRMRTGGYCDYRNRSASGMVRVYDRDKGYSGLPYTQWLATCLEAMGVPASEWQGIENNGAAGYGYPLVAPEYDATYVAGVKEGASAFLPFLDA